MTNYSFSDQKRNLSKVIGITVDVTTINKAVSYLQNLIKSGISTGIYVCVANVHMLTIARGSVRFHEILKNASLVVPDGVPLVWSQRLSGFKQAQRVCGPDLMLALCNSASKANQPIFLLGSTDNTLSLLSNNLAKLFPQLIIAGTHAPDQLPEQPPLDIKLVDKINASGTSILFVSLGCPKQENWCATHSPHLKAICLGVGAAFDFHAGTKTRSPIWIQQYGLEWLYRLLSEPRRLWKRYLATNCQFIWYYGVDVLKNVVSKKD